MHQPRLFKIAPDAIAITARWEHPDGWSLTITASAAGPDGRSTVTDRYDRLASDELPDLVCAVVHGSLQGVSG